MTVIKSVFRMERRELLKWSALSAASMMVCDFDALYAAGVCDNIEGLNNLGAALNGATVLDLTSSGSFTPGGGELLYWIDGPFGKSWGKNDAGVAAAQTTRAKLSLLVDLPHNSAEFLESVIVADSSLKLVAVQHFTPADASSRGRAPYVIFDSLSFEDNLGYNVYFTMRKANINTVYRFVLSPDKIRQSRMDYTHLGADAKAKIPAKLIRDLTTGQANHQFDASDVDRGRGIFTTAYQHFAPQAPHTVRARNLQIKPNGDFSVEIAPMHGAVGAAGGDNLGHYQRYFLVLDPVGQILGALKRMPDDVLYAATAEYMTVERGFKGDKTEFLQESLDNMKLRNINDCPFVQLICEDVRDACARVTLRLR